MPGVIELAVQDIFSYAKENATEREFLVRVSYLEVSLLVQL